MRKINSEISKPTEQLTDYYPYGLPMATSSAPTANRVKYGAKELATDHGVNLYDFSARWQNPAFPHFTTPDQLAGKYRPVSPYAYCAADPINFTDPTGMDVWETNDMDEITDFINAVINGKTVFDFSGWIHNPSEQFTKSVRYDDEEKVFYYSYGTVIDNEVTVISQAYHADLKPVSYTGEGYVGAFVYEPFNNPLLLINHFLDNITYGPWTVNSSGRITHFTPLKGFPPDFGKKFPLKGGKVPMGRRIGKMPGNHALANKQIDDLAYKHRLTKDGRAMLHRRIGHEGLGYHEIEELIYDLFGK